MPRNRRKRCPVGSGGSPFPGFRHVAGACFSATSRFFPQLPMSKADGDSRARGAADGGRDAASSSGAESKNVKPASSTIQDDIPPVHVLVAAEQQDRKETEDLLASFDRPGRGPKVAPRERDFVDSYAKKPGGAGASSSSLRAASGAARPGAAAAFAGGASTQGARRSAAGTTHHRGHLRRESQEHHGRVRRGERRQSQDRVRGGHEHRATGRAACEGLGVLAGPEHHRCRRPRGHRRRGWVRGEVSRCEAPFRGYPARESWPLRSAAAGSVRGVSLRSKRRGVGIDDLATSPAGSCSQERSRASCSGRSQRSARRRCRRAASRPMQ